MFRVTVKEWLKKHLLIDKKIDELSSGFYILKRCKVKKLCNDVKVMCDSSTVQRMYGSSTVRIMYGSSTVQEMYGSSTVQEMYGSSVARDYSKNKIYISNKSSLEIERRD